MNIKNIFWISFILSLTILPLLVILTLINTEYLYNFQMTGGYLVWFFLYMIVGIFGYIFFRKKRFQNKVLHSECMYTLQSIVLFTIFFLPAVLVIHFFLREHISEANLYLRAYGKIAFLFLTLSLCISPLLNFIKSPWVREWLLLSRKIFGILSFLFFLKHGLEYFIAEYVFQTKYHGDVSYLSYVLENLLVRNDALTGVIAGICMMILGLSSNKVSVKLLSGKGWKTLQSLVYPAFLLSLIHIAFSSRFDIFYAVLGGIVVALRTGVYLFKKDIVSTGKTTKYLCEPCGYIYDEALGDPDGGILPGTKFEDIPDDWVCPVCGAGKADFVGYYNSQETIFSGDIGTILSYQFLTRDVLELVVASEKVLHILAGQYMSLILQDFDGTFTRSFSVVAQEQSNITFLIKCKDTGRAGRALRNYTVGDKIPLKGVYGNFILQNTQKPRVYIASGTGLAPIYRMISLDTQAQKGTLLFSVPTKEDIFYAERLKNIAGLETHIYLTREEQLSEEAGIHFHLGRMDLGNYHFSPETEFYICGAPALVDDSKKYLEAQGYTHIYFEKFSI